MRGAQPLRRRHPATPVDGFATDSASNGTRDRPILFPARNRHLLRTHLWLPLIGFTFIFGVIELRELDPVIAHAWYFDEAAQQWLGTGPGAWWARGLLHTGGRWVVRGVAAGAILVWALSFAFERWRHWRRAAGFVAVAMVIPVSLVGGLKAITNVDCPWDLAGFGGSHEYVLLFADRPDALPRAQCFPGAHASSGFALMCFYFLLRDQRRRFARWALAAAIGVGIAFSVGQEARGAHFFSHDLVSAALVWFTQLALYLWLLATEPASTDRPIYHRLQPLFEGAAQEGEEGLRQRHEVVIR
jgi:membrane-associated PAP2 superfamily phosphatase